MSPESNRHLRCSRRAVGSCTRATPSVRAPVPYHAIASPPRPQSMWPTPWPRLSIPKCRQLLLCNIVSRAHRSAPAPLHSPPALVAATTKNLHNEPHADEARPDALRGEPVHYMRVPTG